MLHQTQSAPVHNIAAEQTLGMVDAQLRRAHNATIGLIDGKVKFKRNETLQWLDSKSESIHNQIVAFSVTEGRKVR